jgi:hypothetical protein
MAGLIQVVKKYTGKKINRAWVPYLFQNGRKGSRKLTQYQK